MKFKINCPQFILDGTKKKSLTRKMRKMYPSIEKFISNFLRRLINTYLPQCPIILTLCTI